MCGRYSLVCIDDLGNRFRVFNPMLGARSRFNIVPGNEMPVIVGAEKNELVLMRWGLIPHWTQDIKSTRPLINARAETIAEKPSFRNLITSSRCLIPASGFFEWKTEGHRKTPFYISLTGRQCFAFAGLFDEWYDPAGKKISSYTIITTVPNDLVAHVHNRMPAILTLENEVRWLSRDVLDTGQIKDILAPYPSGDMTIVPVSPLINNPAIDDERVIAPVNSFSHM